MCQGWRKMQEGVQVAACGRRGLRCCEGSAGTSGRLMLTGGGEVLLGCSSSVFRALAAAPPPPMGGPRA